VAAGLVNPVAGRNFEPSWEVAASWKIALPFYQSLGDCLFHSVPIMRLWFDEKDRAKFERKRGLVHPWVVEVTNEGVLWSGGGWLDCPRFLQVAREEFLKNGGEWQNTPLGGSQIWCAGAAGLIRGDFPEVEHRSAKGEVLTVRIPGWEERRILNRAGWVIPLGKELYRVGATYDWDQLESGPTGEGRGKVEAILQTFTDRDYEVIDHVAGIRPIVDRSKPVVRFQEGKGWMVNGLGSKGVIYAPRVGLEIIDRIK
jgi:glycine/D-amino acid oxidase-like deaminating enzyme